jgi:hypothetical protein
MERFYGFLLKPQPKIKLKVLESTFDEMALFIFIREIEVQDLVEAFPPVRMEKPKKTITKKKSCH